MPPCIDSCTSLHALRSAMSNVCSGGSIERVKVFLRQVELRKLREGSQTHQQGVPENQVQSLQLAPCGWCCPFFLLFFLLPAVHCDLLTGLDGSLPFFRKGTDDVLGVDETPASLPWSRYWPRRSWSRSGHHRWVCLDHLFRGPHDLE